MNFSFVAILDLMQLFFVSWSNKLLNNHLKKIIILLKLEFCAYKSFESHWNFDGSVCE